jgi:hypothetical protein
MKLLFKRLWIIDVVQKRLFSKEHLGMEQNIKEIFRGADKSLAFPISCVPICSITKDFSWMG